MSRLVEQLEARSTRGTERGADAVFGAAVEPARAPHGPSPELVSLAAVEVGGAAAVRSVEPAQMSHRRWRVLLAAAVIVALGGFGVSRLTGPRHDNAPAAELPRRVVDGWAPIPAAPLSARIQYVSVATPTGLFVWGGFGTDTVLSDGAFLNRASGQWRTLPPAPLDPDRGDAIGTWDGHEVIVLNGFTGIRAAAFDPATFTWRALPAPPGQTQANNASTRLATIGGVVVFTHHTSDGAPFGVELFDPATSTWSTAASPPSSLQNADIRTTASDDELYVLATPTNGGNQCSVQQPIARYDPASNVWTSLTADVPRQGWWPTVFSWAGDQLILAGGSDCGTGTAVSDAESLDPSTSKWRTIHAAPVELRATSSDHRYDDATWTGTQLISLQADGQPITYHPSTDAWHVGPTFLDTNGSLADTPGTWFDGALVVISAGVDRADGTPTACCTPTNQNLAYTPRGLNRRSPKLGR